MNDLEAILVTHGYILVEPIGKGGSANCYIVRSTKYDMTFVAKAIDMKGKLKDGGKGLYFSEVDALCSVIHPNIIQIYDHIEEDHYLILILEHCPRGSVENLIKEKGTVTPPDLFSYIRQSMIAINYCHQRQIAHHDIKPSNFLVSGYNRIKLADFGLARFYEDDTCNCFFGSYAYAAPELLQKHTYDPFKADVWSFGVSIYQMAAGYLPFSSQSTTVLKNKIVSGIYAMPEELPEYVKKVIRLCLRMNPSERPTFVELLKIEPPKGASESQVNDRHGIRRAPSNCAIPLISPFRSMISMSSMQLSEKKSLPSIYSSVKLPALKQPSKPM